MHASEGGGAKADLVVLGCGYSASRFLDLHRSDFNRAAATSRSEEKVAALEAASFDALLFDGAAIGPILAQRLAKATHLLVSIPPGPAGDPVLSLLADVLTPRLGWIGYLSTVGVYGDTGGAWIDESAATDAAEPRSLRRIEAERGWIHLAADRGAALQLFRIAGIYGPGRNALRQMRDGSAKRIVKPGQVFNRVHVDDIAGAIAAGISRPDLTGPINLCDDEPAPPQDVVAFAAKLLGRPPPPEVPFEEAGMSPMARSFWSSNKRVANRRLHDDFGYDLKYPTYREGLQALLAEGE